MGQNSQGSLRFDKKVKNLPTSKSHKNGKVNPQVTLVLVNNNSSPRSVLHDSACPPCKLICININKKHKVYFLSQSCTDDMSVSSNFQSFLMNLNEKQKAGKMVLTFAEAPRGFRSTTCSIPFLSLVTSTAAL